MSVGSVLVGMGLLSFVLFAVTMPWRRSSDEKDSSPNTTGGSVEGVTATGSTIEAARDGAYAALVDLDFDRQIGKLNEDDYQAVRTDLMGEAVVALQQLDQSNDATERQLESLIEARRRTLARPASRSKTIGSTSCSACGARLGAGDRFCGGCGSPAGTTCPHCGSGIKQSDHFCKHCGRLVVQGAIPA